MTRINKYYLSFLKKMPSVIGIFLILFSSLFNFIPSFLSPKEVKAANSCSASGMPSGSGGVGVGGVSLNQAATFLADMTDYTGAYYDQSLDRIVFIGKTETSVPKFDKDDLAVAIKSIIFENTLPAVTIVNKAGDTNYTQPQDVVFSGPLVDTKFGQVILDADYKLKQYIHGFDTNGNPISSSVSGYKSFLKRYADAKGGALPGTGNSRWWITPDLITLKRDNTSKSFAFDQVVMQIKTEPLDPGNETLWNQEADNFSNHLTANYDSYAQEIPSFRQTKQLAKIVAVVKWIKDNNIASDFEWAEDYQPAYAATTRETQRLNSQVTVGGTNYSITGGVDYYESNTYNSDDGTAVNLKNAAQAQSSQKEDVHWTFTQGGVAYNAVAVEASAFRNVGAYNTSAADLATPISNDINLNFTRTYSSFNSNIQKGMGLGWNVIPAVLKITNSFPVTCSGGRSYAWKVSIRTPEGYETFTKSSCADDEYTPDDPAYNTRVFQNSDYTFIARLKDQTEYKFDVYSNNNKLLEYKDKNGNKLTYNYTSGKLTSITDSNSHTLNISYTGDLITSISDWASRTVSYTYDGTKRLSTVTDPEGGVTTYTYDSNNNLATIKNRLNQVVLTNTYNADGKLATQKDAANITTTFSYNYSTNTISSTDTNSRSGSTIYDSKARTLKQYDAASNYVENTYGDEYSPLTVKDRRGNTVTYTYDSAANVKSVTDSEGLKLEFNYDSKNNPTYEKDSRYSPQFSPKETTFTYDSNGNLTQKSDGTKTSSYTYNSKGQVLTYTNPRSKTTTYTRDSFDNPLTVTDPYSKVITNTYDSLGRLTQNQDANSKTISYTYDKNNSLLTKTDSSGTATNVYDDENRLSRTTLPNGSITEYSYNSSNSLTSLKDPLNNLTSYGLDAYQNMTSKEDSLSRVTDYAFNNLNRRTQSETPLGKTTGWEYDANGNITKRIDGNNAQTTYGYDALNRLTSITYPDSSTVAYTYDKRNNLKTMVSSLGTTTYVYDAYDRLTSATDPYSQVTTYAYDNNDNLTSITYPGSKTTTFAYDNNDRLATVTEWNSNQVAYQYNDNGTLLSKTLPNGVVTGYTYDNTNRVKAIEHKKGDEILAKLSYDRDSIGNIKTATESGTMFTPSQTQSDKYVIVDQGLTSGWDDWSWSSTNNFTSTSNPYSGNQNTSWTLNSGYGALRLNKTGGVSTVGYSNLTFAIKGSASGQSFQVQLYDSAGSSIGSPLSLSSYGGNPVTSNYKLYTIPLSDLGAANSKISGLMIQDLSGTSQPAVSVDYIALVGNKVDRNMSYEESLNTDWQDWSWSSTNNFSNTTNTYSGVNNLSWTATSGYAGLSLHKVNGFNTNGYSNLTFALKASQSGQNVQVQLIDSSNNTIGSAVTLGSYGGNPVSSAYKVYNIPIADLSASDRQVNGILIQDITGSSQPAMFIDSVGFTKSVVTSYPQDKLTVFDDQLESGWNDWSWDSTNKFDDVSYPYIGTKNMAWKVNSGYAALSLSNPSGISTTGYTSLSLALQPTQSGQTVQVQLYNSSDSPIGSAINIANYGGNPTTGGYKSYTIPLKDLGGDDKTIKRIQLQDTSGNPQPAMYIDSIVLLKQKTTYAYDALGRLTSSQYPNGNSFSYTYDKVGNRTAQNINGTASTHTNNNDNQLTSDGTLSYTYDNNGNQITRGGSIALTYDYDSRLTSFNNSSNSKNTQYIYDSKGHRLKEKVNSTDTNQYVNDVSGDLTKVLINKDLQRGVNSYYVYGLGLISEGEVDSPSRQYYLEDGLGNIRFTTDNNGASRQINTYDPYGNRLAGSSTVDFQFKGEQPGLDTNLTFMRARYYDPANGRFISRDPVEGVLTNPQSHNSYSYAHNDPVNLSDPSGLAVNGICLSCSAGAGGYVSSQRCFGVGDNWQFGATKSISGGGNPNVGAGVDLTWLYSDRATRMSDLYGTSGVVSLGVETPFLNAGITGQGNIDLNTKQITQTNAGISGGFSMSPVDFKAGIEKTTAYTPQEMIRDLINIIF